MKLAFLHEALEKFALSGATYARALQNASARGTGRVGAPVLGAIASQPRAKLMPGLSQQARQTAKLPTNVPGRNQALFDTLPQGINTDQPFSSRGGQERRRFDQALRRGGAAYSQPGIQAKINESFGAPVGPRKQVGIKDEMVNLRRTLGNHAARQGDARLKSQDTRVIRKVTSKAASLGSRAALYVLGF